MNQIKNNLVYQTISQVGGKGLMFLVYMLLARILGPELFGKFDYNISYVHIVCTIFFELGLMLVVTSELSAGNNKVFSLAIFIKICGCIIGCTILYIITIVLDLNLILLIFLTLYLLFNSFSNLYFTIFRAKNSMSGEAITVVVQRALLLISLLFIHLNFIKIPQGSILTATGFYFFITALIGFFLILALTRFQFPEIKFLINPYFASMDIKKLTKQTMPLIGVTIFWIIYYKIDIILLGQLSTKEQVGFYSAAYRIMEASFIIPIIITNSVYPKLSNLFANDSRTFIMLIKKTAYTLFAIGLFVGIAVYYMEEMIISLLFGDRFIPSGDILVILIMALIIVYPGQLMAHSLVIMKKQMTYLWISIAVAALNIVLNIIFIPIWAAKGAAFSTIISEALVTVMAIVVIHKYIKSQKAKNENWH